MVDSVKTRVGWTVCVRTEVMTTIGLGPFNAVVRARTRASAGVNACAGVDSVEETFSMSTKPAGRGSSRGRLSPCRAERG